SARVWDSESGQPVSPPLTHTRQVSGLAFSPDGRRLATVSQDGYGRIWDVRTGKLLATLPYRPGYSGLRTVLFSQDGSCLVTASDTDMVLWHPTTGRRLGKVFGDLEYVESIAVSPDGKHVAAAIGDHPPLPISATPGARIWNTSSGALEFVLPHS